MRATTTGASRASTATRTTRRARRTRERCGTTGAFATTTGAFATGARRRPWRANEGVDGGVDAMARGTTARGTMGAGRRAMDGSRADARTRTRTAADATDGSKGVDVGGKTGYRFVVVGLVAFALMLCNADRVIMSVASVPLAAANGWGERAVGLVQSSFLWGYALTPLVGGWLADTYGGKVVLGGGIAIWSLATLFTPFAASAESLAPLLVTRATMGLGEGVALPCMNNIISRWVPRAERSRAVAVSMGGFQSGSMIGLLAAPVLLARAGVPGPFVVFGVLGLVWAIIWQLAATTYPKQCKMVGADELRHIVDFPGGALTEAERADRSTRGTPPFKLLLSKAPTWACIIANFVNNWGIFILLAWMPLYFKQVIGVNLRTAAWFSALPWATMAASGIVAGTLADNLINIRGWTTTRTRKFIQGVGFIGPSLCLLVLAVNGSNMTAARAVATLTVACGCMSFSQAGFLVNFQEIGPKYAGVLHGMANTAGSIAGMVGTYATGAVLEATGGNWSAVLYVTAFVYALGATTWLAMSTGERVFD